MNVAIVHYHLRRGGVTRVIESACAALRGTQAKTLVFSGEAPPPGMDFGPVKVFPGLDYRVKNVSPLIAESLLDAMQETAKKHFGAPPDLWHFHNHSLGKNVMMPLLVRGLSDAKQRLLLQLHDFPEDGRPQNYVNLFNFFGKKQLGETLYPLASHVHYAVINSRDLNFLKSAGMRPDQVHYLPNSATAIALETRPEDRPFFRDRRFLLYPTRAIRRKNIGELLLLALAHRDSHAFGISLVPDNPEWQPRHQRWQELAEELDLPVEFGMAEPGRHRFADLVGWSDGIITTSVAEGFGLAFLEPWLNDRIVTGRNLPRITADFTSKGIKLDHLYQRTPIPLEWIGRSTLREEADRHLRRIYLGYDFPVPGNAADLTLSRWIEDDAVDFGMLNEDYQIAIIQRAAADRKALAELAIPRLNSLPESLIAHNKAKVEEGFSLHSYRDMLTALYQKVAHSAAARKVQSYRPEKILKEFLDPWRLNLLRT